MLRERREQRARMAEVVAELRAAEGVLEGMHAVDASGMACAGNSRNARGEVADAADGRNDPYLVACPDASVGAQIALESLDGDRRVLLATRRVGTLKAKGVAAVESSHKIVAVDMLARGDGGACDSDRKAEFDDGGPLRNRRDRKFMAAPNRRSEPHRDSINDDVFVRAEVANRGGDIIGRNDVDGFLHIMALSSDRCGLALAGSPQARIYARPPEWAINRFGRPLFTCV